MEFLITKTSDEDYKEIKKFENLKELLNFQKTCNHSIILTPFYKSNYEEYSISKNHEIVSIIEIYDYWRE